MQAGGALAHAETHRPNARVLQRETSMRNFDLLQISKQLIVANDKSGIPAHEALIPPPPLAVPERAPARRRDVADRPRPPRNDARDIRLNRALRPRRRS